jgi:hypothetical protein
MGSWPCRFHACYSAMTASRLRHLLPLRACLHLIRWHLRNISRARVGGRGAVSMHAFARDSHVARLSGWRLLPRSVRRKTLWMHLWRALVPRWGGVRCSRRHRVLFVFIPLVRSITILRARSISRPPRLCFFLPLSAFASN